MKMVKVGDKMVPFFAADGKGANDLKKALYGAKMKQAAYGAKMEMGMGGKMYEMMGGGMVKLLQEGGTMNGNGDGDPTKKSPYSRTEETARVVFTPNEGMMSAQGEGKIDAFNFDVPDGGLDAMSPEEQERLKATPFGKSYLSGSGSLDDQYRRYSARVMNFIDDNPEKALVAADEMIASGNTNFSRALEGKSDEEKLRLMRSYMTDKKIGDFHGAIEFGERLVPTAQFYDPNPELDSAGLRVDSVPRVLNAVGDRQVRPGDISRLAASADAAGIDLSSTSEESMDFVSQFMDEFGSQERAKDYVGTDNQYFIDKGKEAVAASLRSREQQQRERQRNRPRYDSRGRLIQEEMNLGGMIYKRANRGTGVKPTEEESDRGVTSVSRGLLNRTEKFGDRGSAKYRTKLGKLLLRSDVKAKF